VTHQERKARQYQRYRGQQPIQIHRREAVGDSECVEEVFDFDPADIGAGGCFVPLAFPWDVEQARQELEKYEVLIHLAEPDAGELDPAAAAEAAARGARGRFRWIHVTGLGASMRALKLDATREPPGTVIRPGSEPERQGSFLLDIEPRASPSGFALKWALAPAHAAAFERQLARGRRVDEGVLITSPPSRRASWTTWRSASRASARRRSSWSRCAPATSACSGGW
jgi:hypothetical protein